MALDYHIRKATEVDVDSILQLIKELADYEKEPDAVKATPELIRQNLFEKKHAQALLAFTGKEGQGGEAVGLALYFFNFSTWTGRPGLYLEDLFVRPEARAGGLGKALFNRLGQIAEENNCARLEWVVLNWNQPSIDFYEKRLGAVRMVDWTGMRLNEDGIKRLRDLV
ncbi:acyl-CoA N-acyltransferase [Coprinopsis sp. MPI-PUGE-AT-0042]|nr:acyl-CoA N-acyltransferase [Coprinopsis sp. MPI-PUGE-AT-0042]